MMETVKRVLTRMLRGPEPIPRDLEPLMIDVTPAAADRGSDSGSTPPACPPALRQRRPDPPLEERSADTHAKRLLAWLQEAGETEVVYGELLERYQEMCLDLWWRELPWIAVSRVFTPMTGGRGYRNVPGSGGRKERIYRIPQASAPRQQSRLERGLRAVGGMDVAA